jgi:hypothetical protein
MLYKIKLWWEFEGRYYHKDFVRGIKNLFRWLPTIWKDRDWDSYYIYEIIRVKLEHQAKYIGDRDCKLNDLRLSVMCKITSVNRLEVNDGKLLTLDYGRTLHEVANESYSNVPIAG